MREITSNSHEDTESGYWRDEWLRIINITKYNKMKYELKREKQSISKVSKCAIKHRVHPRD